MHKRGTLSEFEGTMVPMANETFHICETCREEVDPGDPNVVRAAEMHDAPGFGQTHDYIEGLTVFFHEHHFPQGSRRFKRLP